MICPCIAGVITSPVGIWSNVPGEFRVEHVEQQARGNHVIEFRLRAAGYTA
jgi:hypothetical protein